jgi:hypothetical protein
MRFHDDLSLTFYPLSGRLSFGDFNVKLHNATKQLFKTFQETGTLGEGATRSKPGMMEKMQSSGGAMAADMFLKWDNGQMDQDDRDNFVKFDKAQAEKAMNSQMDEAFDELVGPTPDLPQLSPEDIAETKEGLRAMGMSEEEIEAMFSGEEAEPKPNSGTYEGFVSQEGNKYEIYMETKSDELKDIEYYVGDDNGYKFMNATDNGDHLAVTAISTSFIGDDEVYKETMIVAK